MTVHNCLLIDVSTYFFNDSLLCTFCIERDKFIVHIPTETANTLDIGYYYDVSFDIISSQFGNQFSFNFINPSKEL